MTLNKCAPNEVAVELLVVRDDMTDLFKINSPDTCPLVDDSDE